MTAARGPVSSLTEPATKNEVPRGEDGVVAFEVETLRLLLYCLVSTASAGTDCLSVRLSVRLSVCDVVLGRLG